MAVKRAVSSHLVANQRTLRTNPPPCHVPNPEARHAALPTVDDRGPVEERQDAGAVHRTPGGSSVRITLPQTTDCNATGAICDYDDNKLSHPTSTTASGPG